jgi:ribonuclease P protein component
MTAGPQKQGAPRRLKKRSEFLRAARGRRAGGRSFSLQATAGDRAEPGVGFTVTNKTGNAPVRNRIRRRLREAVRACATRLEPQHDYVLIGRREALKTPFGELVDELSAAITKIHASKAERRRNER